MSQGDNHSVDECSDARSMDDYSMDDDDSTAPSPHLPTRTRSPQPPMMAKQKKKERHRRSDGMRQQLKLAALQKRIHYSATRINIELCAIDLQKAKPAFTGTNQGRSKDQMDHLVSMNIPRSDE